MLSPAALFRAGNDARRLSQVSLPGLLEDSLNLVHERSSGQIGNSNRAELLRSASLTAEVPRIS
jgi:hypothetical protein